MNHAAVVPEGYLIPQTNELPPRTIYWFRNKNQKLVCGLVYFGENLPQIMVSHRHCNFYVLNLKTDRIFIPQDGGPYIISPSLELVRTNVDLESLVVDYENYSKWGAQIKE